MPVFPTMRPTFGLSLFSLCFLACGQPLSTSAAADVDYAQQGEYLGTNVSTGNPVAAQVMALGSGTFRLLLLNGGLPGQGWDGLNPKIVAGSLQAGTAKFTQATFNLTTTAAGDSLRGTSETGQTLRMAKVFRQSSSSGQAAPAGSIVLFNGSSAAGWTNGMLDADHNLIVNPAASGMTSQQSYGDFTLHLEFNLPFEPASSGQNRGNSGIYLQGRYELQILDSFGQSLSDLAASDSIEPRRQCGAFYEQSAPSTNMSYPPLTWQTYDIDFTAARWNSSSQKTDNARVTIRQNGIVIHQNRSLPGPTLLGNAESSATGPLLIQYHGHTVLFRNIWITGRTGTPLNRPASPKKSRPLLKSGGASHYGLTTPETSFFLTPDGRRMRGGSLLAFSRL